MATIEIEKIIEQFFEFKSENTAKFTIKSIKRSSKGQITSISINQAGLDIKMGLPGQKNFEFINKKNSKIELKQIADFEIKKEFKLEAHSLQRVLIKPCNI